MFNIFNSSVFIEIGEAIGNVGRKAFRRKRGDAELVDKIFRRRLDENRGLTLPLDGIPRVSCDDQAIDAEFRVLGKGEL